MNSHIVCFDIGGSSLKCALCDRTGTLLKKTSFKMVETLESLCECMKSFKEEMETQYEIEGVAISSCGAVNCETGYIGGSSAVPFIHGCDWKKIIKDQLELPCEIENDANCAALSELYFGKAKNISDMCFLVIGTGVGGAIVNNRKIHHGKHLYGGEFGMYLLKDASNNIMNTSLVASTSSMARKLEELQGGEWDGVKVFKEAQKGNQACVDAITTFYEEIAFCVFNIQHTIDPELILFGGAISAREDFCDCVMEAYKQLCERIDIETLTPKLMCCSYLQDANILGALANYIQRRT